MRTTAVDAVGLSRSESGKRRLLSVRGEPFLIADWDRALMVHYEVDPADLRKIVPFKLDLRNGSSFVTLVAFTLNGMRLRWGGRLGRWLLKPIASHPFLNVRTYVQRDEETGIFFLAEWLSNPLSVTLGPRLFGLPYRRGTLSYHHAWERGSLSGNVSDVSGGGSLTYQAALTVPSTFEPCQPGSLAEWLMERYTAFTCVRANCGFFRVWHPPWNQTPLTVKVTESVLLAQAWPFFREAQYIGANFSPGLPDVWMGRPHQIRGNSISGCA